MFRNASFIHSNCSNCTNSHWCSSATHKLSRAFKRSFVNVDAIFVHWLSLCVMLHIIYILHVSVCWIFFLILFSIWFVVDFFQSYFCGLKISKSVNKFCLYIKVGIWSTFWSYDVNGSCFNLYTQITMFKPVSASKHDIFSYKNKN